jgi:hypothetical protein
MAKEINIQHEVQSSNLKSIGWHNKTIDGKPSSVVRVEFQRGASYDYWPVTAKEFNEAFAPGVVLKDWFNKFKTGKNFKQVV